jgi:hypothetical protein
MVNNSLRILAPIGYHDRKQSRPYFIVCRNEVWICISQNFNETPRSCCPFRLSVVGEIAPPTLRCLCMPVVSLMQQRTSQ